MVALAVILSVETGEPFGQSLVEIFSGYLSWAKVRLEVEAMLGIRHDVSEYSVSARFHIALWDFCRECHMWGGLLSGKGRKGPPRVELATAPVDIGWANAPPSSYIVGGFYLRTLRHQARFQRLGKLSVAGILHVVESLVPGQKGVRTKVIALIVPPFRAKLPSPTYCIRVDRLWIKHT